LSALDRVLDQAIKLVEPTAEEARALDKTAQRIFQRVQGEARKVSPQPEVVFGGSFARGTWLKGEADIDLFLKFPPDETRELLKQQGLNIGRRALKNYRPRLRYAEHPYVEGFVNSTRVNVVACFDVERGKWKSAADRSPYHTDFIKERFDDSLRREARLVKRFMRGLGIYGAEIAVQGFSGYVCEVLTLKFGSFLNMVSSVAKFTRNQAISIEKAPDELVKIFRTPLIILDPIDIRRNLAAAISGENVAKFIASSRNFLKDPALNFFLGPKPSKVIHSYGISDHLLAVVFKHSRRSEDILWGQLRRTLSFLRRQLELGGFVIFRSIPASDNLSESALLFLVNSYSISRRIIKVGPDVYRAQDLSRFVEKNRGTRLMWVGEDARTYALTERKISDSALFVRTTIRDQRLGLAPGLRDDFSRGFTVLRGDKARGVLARKKWLWEAVMRLVSTDKLAFGAN